ncbi:hypothetical protein MACK_002998 [Theileria orientalis]|uniref:ATP-dependent RNA helicase n=1 Tax=Theileria orientalis TaxID=68886 RepID=A0A976MED5_THEOR|nr:hypothetical protein MACK_002998 [Theileria orientalis]
MICEVDKNYINKFVKNRPTITEDRLGRDARLTYYIYHLLLSNNIERFDELFDYVSGYERMFERMILSSSYVKRTIDLNTQSSDEFSQSIENDSDGFVDLDIVEDKYVDNVNVNVIDNLSVGNNYNVHHIVNDTVNLNEEEHVSSDTSVIDKMTFYYALVKDAPNIVLQIGYKIEVLVNILSSVKYNKCIIFTNQSHMRAQTYGILKYLGYTCYIISSRMSHAERVMMLYDLSSVNNVIILCTDVMSRGIGISNVDLVINMDIPGSKEIFLHRSGRSGRFGSKGVCVSICMESELETYKYFLFSLNFKSDSVGKLYDSEGCLNENISYVLMKTINFVKLEDELPDIKNIMNKTLTSWMLDTEDYKFKVSIIGFISHTDMMFFNTTKTQTLMYIDVVGYETVITIKTPEDNELFLESLSSKVQLVYSERDINYNNDINNNNNILPTHIIHIRLMN